MLHRQQLVIAFLLGSVASSGCKTSNSAPTTQASPAHQPTALISTAKPTTTPSDPVVLSPAETPAPGTAQALAQRATSYAQPVGPLLSQHSAPKPAEASDWP